MKLAQFRTLIREEVRKATAAKTKRIAENRNPLTEAISEQKVLNILYKEVAKALKNEGFKKKISPTDLQTIALEWLRVTLESDYVGETFGDDIFENSVIEKILTKYDPNFDGSFDDDDY